MQSPWASNSDWRRLGRVQAAAQTFGCQGDKPLRGNRQWIPSCSHARLGRHLLLSGRSWARLCPGAALREGSLDLAPLGEAGTWGSKGTWAPADGHQWTDFLVRRPTPLSPLDSAWGWRVLFQKIWLAGTSAPASGSPAATPRGHHTACCCPVGVWKASLEAPTGHRSDCSTPTAAVAHVLTLKPTLLMAFGGRGTALPRVPGGGERRLS